MNITRNYYKLNSQKVSIPKGFYIFTGIYISVYHHVVKYVVFLLWFCDIFSRRFMTSRFMMITALS